MIRLTHEQCGARVCSRLGRNVLQIETGRSKPLLFQVEWLQKKNIAQFNKEVNISEYSPYKFSASALIGIHNQQQQIK